MTEDLEQKPKNQDEIVTKAEGTAPGPSKVAEVRSILKTLPSFEAQDETILKANEASLTLDWQTAIIAGGVDQYLNGKPLGRVFAARSVGKGGMGIVHDACFVEPNSLELKFGVSKTAVEIEGEKGELVKAVFENEKESAVAIQSFLEKNPQESGAQNIAKPLLVADKMVIYEKVGDADTLARMMNMLRPSDWLFYFSGAIKGLAFLHRHGLHHMDFKPGNIVIGHDEGVLIDYSGIRKKGKFKMLNAVYTQDYYPIHGVVLQEDNEDPVADILAVGICLRTYLLKNRFLEVKATEKEKEIAWPRKLPLISPVPQPMVRLYDLCLQLTALPRVDETPLEKIAETIQEIATELKALEKTVSGSIMSPVEAKTISKDYE